MAVYGVLVMIDPHEQRGIAAYSARVEKELAEKDARIAELEKSQQWHPELKDLKFLCELADLHLGAYINDARPRTGVSPSTAEIVVKPTTINAKYSAGPNVKARFASVGAATGAGRRSRIP